MCKECDKYYEKPKIEIELEIEDCDCKEHNGNSVVNGIVKYGGRQSIIEQDAIVTNGRIDVEATFLNLAKFVDREIEVTAQAMLIAHTSRMNDPTHTN